MSRTSAFTEASLVRLKDGTYRARLRWTDSSGAPREVLALHEMRAIAMVIALNRQESAFLSDALAEAEMT